VACPAFIPPHPDPPPPGGREKNDKLGPARRGWEKLLALAILCYRREDEMPGSVAPGRRAVHPHCRIKVQADTMNSMDRHQGTHLPGRATRRKAGTGDLFRLSCRKSCLRMPHSPDRTATTAGLIDPNQSVVLVHFEGIPPCPIRLRVPHPSSFPRESGVGRPGTAGCSSAVPNQGSQRNSGLYRFYSPPPCSSPTEGGGKIGGPAPPPPGGREIIGEPVTTPPGGRGKLLPLSILC
jgi:hypothetical protein